MTIDSERDNLSDATTDAEASEGDSVRELEAEIDAVIADVDADLSDMAETLASDGSPASGAVNQQSDIGSTEKSSESAASTMVTESEVADPQSQTRAEPTDEAEATAILTAALSETEPTPPNEAPQDPQDTSSPSASTSPSTSTVQAQDDTAPADDPGSGDANELANLDRLLAEAADRALAGGLEDDDGGDPVPPNAPPTDSTKLSSSIPSEREPAPTESAVLSPSPSAGDEVSPNGSDEEQDQSATAHPPKADNDSASSTSPDHQQDKSPANDSLSPTGDEVETDAEDHASPPSRAHAWINKARWCWDQVPCKDYPVALLLRALSRINRPWYGRSAEVQFGLTIVTATTASLGVFAIIYAIVRSG